MKKPYQLLMAIAMPVSLLIYIQPENHTLFYAVGLVVAILLFLALASSIVLRFRNKKKPQQEEQAS
jgi:phosphotransferase system  glucose/maltose/N-acetylglucosamine-specific IIC component